MPRVTQNTAAAYYEPDATGPVAQLDLSAKGPGASIANGATFDTGALYADGFKVIAAAVRMSLAGTLTIQRYLDEAGTIPQGAAVSAAVTAGANTVVNVGDNLPFVSFRVTVANTGSGASAVAAFVLLLNAN